MNSVISKLFFVFSAIILTACAATSSVDSYVNPVLNKSSVKSIAVMPLTNQRVNVGQALTSNQRFVTGLRNKMSGIAISSGPDAIQRINDANLADAWNNFIVGYTQSGVPNSSTLRSVAGVLGVDSIAVGSISRIREQDAGWYQYPYIEISLKYTIFDKNGTILWEASSDTKKEGYASKPPMGEVLNEAVSQIVEKLP
ncbi:hypothetical protein ACFOHU_16265 [Ottowia pentelensis]|uniref:Penicillin-binding protein activator LpoB n=1 Tax=Ottowia pentelensis TaxID=511108 RepID=A0ABV6PWD0_9BURK